MTTICKRRICGYAKDFTTEREGLAVDNCPKHRLYLDQTSSTTVRARAKRGGRRMIRDEVRRMLGAYVDKELELTRQPDLEKHLAVVRLARLRPKRLTTSVH